MGVNSLPETVTRQRRDCDLNPGPSAPESSRHQHRYNAIKTVKSTTVSTGQKGSKSTFTTASKDTQMKKHTALKQNIKNDTFVEFRRDIKALTLLADITSSGNLFHSSLVQWCSQNFSTGVRNL